MPEGRTRGLAWERDRGRWWGTGLRAPPGPRDTGSKAGGFLTPSPSPGGKCPVVIRHSKVTLQVLRRAAKRPSDIFPAIKPVHLMTPWAAGPAAAGPRRGRLPAPAQAAVLSRALYSSQTRWQCPAPDGRSPRAHWRALELRPSGLRGRRPLLPPRGHTRNTGLDREPVHLQHLLRTGGSEPGHPGKGGPRGEGRLPRCGGRSTGMLKARGGGRRRQQGSELGLAVTRLRDKGPRAEKGDTRPDRER